MPKVSREVGRSSITDSRRINCVFNAWNVGEDGAGGRSPAWPRLRPQTETRGEKGGFGLFVEVKIWSSRGGPLIQIEQRAERGLNRTPL